jgi:membrane peptidoglycan carboxypeptidase
MQHAVIATEDRTFYENDGVDFAGIVRAAWNNVTGGERQGASTITQQYARKLAELTTEASYKRKMQEAAIAMKLADKYSKDEILGFYLNTVYFGRGAYGVEAAARAYFGRNSAMELTVEESIMLAGFIKNPDGGGGTSSYDPNVAPNDGKARWEGNRDGLIEVKPKLVKYGSDTYEVSADMQMPVPPKYDRNQQTFQSQFGLDRPTGHVVHNVMDELAKLQKTDKNISQIKDLKNSGLKIVTTIDVKTQQAAETYADLANQKSPLHGSPQNLQGALVAVEPFTGRVIAYYGGPKGEGADYAGAPADPVLDDGKMKMFGFHQPASSFKVYSLGAGLTEDISVNSLWNGKSPRKYPGGRTLKNSAPEGGCESCELWKMTVNSLNIPFYTMTLDLKNRAASVLEFARAAGIRYMRDDAGKVYDLNSAKATELATTGRNTGTVFDTEIAFGQYAVTVLDHANGLATLAAGGNAAKVHFIREAWKDNSKVYTEGTKLTQVPGFSPQMAADMAWTLRKVADKYGWVPSGQQVAAKTGTWETNQGTYAGQNAHSWTVGYTASVRGDKNPAKNWNGLAVAVWVGNKAEELPIKTKGGEKMQGSSGAGLIFKAFMKAATQGKPGGKFPEARFVGDENAGDGTPPPPSQDPNQPGNSGQPGNPPGNTGPGGGGGNGGGNGRPTRPGRG